MRRDEFTGDDRKRRNNGLTRKRIGELRTSMCAECEHAKGCPMNDENVLSCAGDDDVWDDVT